MSAAWTEIPWSEPLLPFADVPPDLATRVKREMGKVSGGIRTIGQVPWMVEIVLLMAARRHWHAPGHLMDLAVLIAARENACRYCYGVGRSIMRALGYTEAQVQLLEQRAELPRDPLDAAVIDFASSLARSQPRPAHAERQRLADLGLTPAATAEIAVMVAVACAGNRIATLLAMPPELAMERLTHGWLSPLGRWLIGSKVKPRKMMADAPVNTAGPYLPHLQALGSHGAAHDLAAIARAAFQDGALPARTKALMALVIGHTLGCKASCVQASELAEAHGLSQSDLESVRHHLTAPSLTPLEQRLVPFARDTVRYDTPAVQRRMREVTQGLERQQVLEVAGTAALANALVRLGMLLE